MSGSHKIINNDKPEHVKKLKVQLQICKGEIKAGNDNSEVIKLKQILMMFYYFGIISLNNIIKHVSIFK